jgi:DNA helicase-2/ATP-dependent DNA helicase PcrA
MTDPFDHGPFDLGPSDLGAPEPPAKAAPYLETLNPEQRLAVETIEGPVLVLAGAGTGKTRVLTTRLAHILNTGRAWPSQLLAVTFTNKAAREMQNRVSQLLGLDVEGLPWLGTFHSVSLKILRRHAELVGLKSGFAVLDVDDQLRVMKQLIDAENLDEKRWPARLLAAYIDRWKNRAVTPENVPNDESYAFADGRGARLYRLYQERLLTLNAADFGDLLLHVITLFRKHPDILEDYQTRFRYVLVDEYQDTNIAQYLWLRLLAQKHKNICCVGDDDQSIYGWRGAEIGNILKFESDFPGATVIRLEQNYRSSQHILSAASGLIAANKGRLGKELWTEIGSGHKVIVKSTWDSAEEARMVSDAIEELAHEGLAHAEIAILVRSSFQMREFEERFVSIGLPYRVIGGPRFYERQEIRDALAYFRTMIQPENDLAFERIVNVPKRGLGDTTLKKLHHLARHQNIPLYRAAALMVETEELSPKARKALSDLIAQFDRWRGLIEDLPHPALAEIILDESGYTAMWQEDRSPKAPARLDNLTELVRAMESYESFAAFLDHVSLVMENEESEAENKVSLMTMHSAKGLEFETVFLPGWEEGLFPHQRAIDEGGLAALEEERRLAYVGITRAKSRAVISASARRRMFSGWSDQIPSRFLEELPSNHIERRAMSGMHSQPAYGAREDSFSGIAPRGWANGGRRRFDAPMIEGRATQVNRSQAARYKVGDRVFHQKFGYGNVIYTDGNKLEIDFEKAGRKRLMDSFVEPA